MRSTWRLAAQRAGRFVPGPVRRFVGRMLPPASTEVVRLTDWTGPLIGSGPIPWPPQHDVAGSGALRDAFSDGTRCLLVTESLDAGGMDEFVAFLARGLGRRGFEIAVLLVPVGVSRGIGPIGSELIAEGVEVVDGVGIDVEAWIRAWGPAVVGVHGNARQPLDAAYRLDIPVMLVLHGMHDLFGMDDAEVRARSERLTAVVSVSELVRRQYLARSPALDPERIVTIPNGIDVDRAVGVDRAEARAALGLDEEYLFVSLSRHSMQKNTFGLVSAFDEVARTHRSAHLLICGRVDDPEYTRQVVTLRDRSPAADRIHLRDGTRRPDVLLAAADGFVLDSFFEGWALSSMEALAVGVPIILSEVGGAREQLAAGPPRGVLVDNPLGDPLAVGWDSMARARFAPQSNRSQLVRAMGAFVRGEVEVAPRSQIAADARARFDADRCLDLHAAALRALVDGRTPTGAAPA